jgi:two-component system sensor kinase FixL
VNSAPAIDSGVATVVAKASGRPAIDDAQRRARAELDARNAEIRALREALRTETRRRETAEAALADSRRQHADDLAAATRSSNAAEIAGTLAHQLAQPLAATLNYLHGCRLRLARGDAIDAARFDDALGAAVGHTEQAGRIVRQVRSFVARHQPDARPVDLAQLIREALELVAGDCAAQDIECRLSLRHGDAQVLAEPLEIQQVLANLIANALDALRAQTRGKRRLSIVSTIVDDGRRVAVSVSDSGAGIAPDVLPRIFDSWFTTKRQGLGLGLAVCRTIIESHGGQLAAGRSTLGGALFRFDLNLVKPA